MILTVIVLVLFLIYMLPLGISALIHVIPPVKVLGRYGRSSSTRTLVVKKFLTGLADGISGYNPTARKAYRTLTDFERPFYIEGACAGLQLATYLAPWRACKNLTKFRSGHEGFLFLLTIGSGFATGLETFWSSSVAARAYRWSDRVDPRLQTLFFDGYAFQKAVFHYLRDPAMLSQGLALEPVARSGFYQGAGRALWFLLANSYSFQAAIAELPTDCAADCRIGFGIASGFAGVESIATGELSTYAPEILASSDFQSGLVVGLFARHYTDPAFLEQLLAKQQPGLLDSVKRAAVLFHQSWRNNVAYQVWRNHLQLQL